MQLAHLDRIKARPRAGFKARARARVKARVKARVRARVRVRVRVRVRGSGSGGMQLAHQRRSRVDTRVVLGPRVLPHAVEVDAAPIGAVVAAEDAVGVEHRDELEDEARPQRGGARVGRVQQESQRTCSASGLGRG